MSHIIKNLKGRRVWDSRGRPTVEVDIELESGKMGRAIAPAGASTGSGEALDLRDKGKKLKGYGIEKALGRVNGEINQALLGMDVTDQEAIDEKLISLDGTDNKQRLGGNAMIATSMAVAHAAAKADGLALWQYLSKDRTSNGSIIIPLPEVQIFGGGAHAEAQIDLQDFMVMPYGASTFAEAMEWVAEIYLAAGDYMEGMGKKFGVADEGGYWPVFKNNEEAIVALVRSIENAGFSANSQVGISLDIAATQFYKDGKYILNADKQAFDVEQWFEVLASWMEAYPIVAIEDPFVEHDRSSHGLFTKQFGDKVQVVGDDLLVTNLHYMDKAKRQGACNTLLCKPNQAGTLTEALLAHQQALANNWATIVSARSGESEDTTIVHLALGWGISQIKVGSFTRSERMAKWNEMIRLEEYLGENAKYAGAAPLNLAVPSKIRGLEV